MKFLSASPLGIRVDRGNMERVMLGMYSRGTITDLVRRNDHTGVLRRIEAGDDVNERRRGNSTPLINAAYWNHVSIVELLLDHGADIEAQDDMLQTALHRAINDRRVEAALCLARRGADANRIGYSLRTPLFSAIKKDLPEVVEELLKRGANPVVVNGEGKTGRDFIRPGANIEWYRRLLAAYTDLDGAITEQNSDAITAMLHKQLSRKDTLVSGSAHDTLLRAFFAAEAGANHAWKATLVRHLEQFELQMLRQALETGSVAQVQSVERKVNKPRWLEHARMGEDALTALHVAAESGRLPLVEHLIFKVGVDVLIPTAEGKLAVEFIRAEQADDRLPWTLTHYTKKASFNNASAALLQHASRAITVGELRQCLGSLTSVYDLRQLLTLGLQDLGAHDMRALLRDAFAEVIEEKLVFDDRAVVFFKMVLRECQRRQLVSEVEALEWDVRATKVNMESAQWVSEIKNALRDVESRLQVTEKNLSTLNTQFVSLRDALIAKERSELAKAERERKLKLVSTALLMCGAPGVTELFGGVLEMWEPVTMLIALTGKTTEEVAEYLVDEAKEIILDDGVKTLLEEASIEAVQFAEVIRDMVLLDKEDLGDGGEQQPIPTAWPVDEEPVVPGIPTNDPEDDDERSSSPRRLVSRPSQRMELVDHSHLAGGALDDYPYHYAVKHSLGDLAEFHDLVSCIDEEDGDINATLLIRVRSRAVDTPFSDWEDLHATALVYASYMGYVNIVKWFISHPDVVKTEKKFLTMNRAKSSSREFVTSA